jgi:3-hydroxyisobutyrate dehydrogenase-like beta-hydroxyacid dehydrogenase
MATVAVIGLGIIGSIWARHYRADGHEVAVWNRTPKPEVPGFVPELSAAVSSADMVHICVADPAAVEAVLAEVLPALPEGALVIQSSTISPAAARGFAEEVSVVGDYLEAPFTGSKPAAEARELVFVMGGESAVVTRAAPFLRGISRKQFHIGTPEQAAAIKLAMNLQIAAVSQALVEGWHLARSHGLTHDTFYEVLRENVAHSGLCELKEPKLRTGDHRPQFSVKHMGKDLRLAIEAAGELQLPQTQLNREIYAQGIAQGLGDLDFIALEQMIRNADPKRD